MTAIPPSPKQVDFLKKSMTGINMTGGSVSAGKTYITNIRWTGYLYLDAPENSTVAIVGRNLGSVYNNVVKFLEENDDYNDLKITKAKDGIVTRIKVISRNIDIVCVGGDNVSSWKSAQGITLAGAYIDEATNIPKTLIEVIIKGCRHGGLDWPVFMTMNPDIPTHYIRQDFILGDEFEARYWHFTLDDNPALTESYKKKVRSLYKGARYRRFILGEWVGGVDALVYHNFDREVNVVPDPIQYDPAAEILTTWDFGVSDPTAVIVLQIKQAPEENEGVIIEVLDSFQDRNQGTDYYKTWASKKEWMGNYKRRDTGDPSGKARGHDLSSWVTGLYPDFDLDLPAPYSVKDFVLNSLLYIPSIRVNEKQNPEVVAMLENWGNGPTDQDDKPQPGAKPIHDDFSHYGTALYYGLAYRFPIEDSFQIRQ